MASQGDSITGTVGDDGKNIGIGKHIDQSTGAVFNNNPVYDQPKQRKSNVQTIDDRFDGFEKKFDDFEKKLDRVVSFIDGNPGYRMVGLPEQLTTYIRENEAWQRDTEKRIKSDEEVGVALAARLSKLEENKKMPVPSSMVWLTIAGLIIFAMTIYILFSWLQRAGQGAAIMPVLYIIALLQGGWRGILF